MIKYGYFMIKMDKSRKGFVTVAIDRPGKDDPHQMHIASFAFCSPRDMFRKSLGRKIANDRLAMKKNTIIIQHNGTVSEVIDKALKQMADQPGGVPSWVKKAIKRNRIQYGLR
jgi:hypothetical protein